jgi:hypothetical protein
MILAYDTNPWMDVAGVDEDFDDSWRASEFIGRQIAQGGAVGMHPDGDRSNWRDTLAPVPLVAHDPPGEGELRRREREYTNRLYMDAYFRAQEVEALAIAEEEARIAEHVAALEAERLWLEQDAQAKHRELLRRMKVNVPIQPGSGRIWRDMVMINEADEQRLKAMSNGGKEVWRGRGFIILKVLRSREVEQHVVMGEEGLV